MDQRDINLSAVVPFAFRVDADALSLKDELFEGDRLKPDRSPGDQVAKGFPLDV